MDLPFRFKALIVGSKAADHQPMIAAAKPFFERIATENQFAVDFTEDAEVINERNLEQYQVFVMLQLCPFDMTYPQQEALQRFIEGGKGWVGIHGAGITGADFLGPGTIYWQWFEDFLGSVTYSPHPAYQSGTAQVEDRTHPATHNVPTRFDMADEWYEFNGNPRPNVRVLVTADESTYHQNKPMGDHPIVWTNERYRRSIYIGLGHDPSAFDNDAYCVLVRDAVVWAGSG